MGPVRVGPERIAVEVGRDVAHEPGVGVVMPGPADGVGRLHDPEVGDAGATKVIAEAHAGQARADHEHMQGFGRRPGHGARGRPNGRVSCQVRRNDSAA